MVEEGDDDRLNGSMASQYVYTLPRSSPASLRGSAIDLTTHPSLPSSAIQQSSSASIALVKSRRDMSSVLWHINSNDMKGDEVEDHTDRRYDCNICFDHADDPVVTTCGHLFCWQCLYLWLSSLSTDPICPLCKSTCSSEDIVPIYTRAEQRQQEEAAAMATTTSTGWRSIVQQSAVAARRRKPKPLPLADVLLLPHIKKPSRNVVSGSRPHNAIPPRPRAKRFRTGGTDAMMLHDGGMQAVFVALYAGWAGLSIFTGNGVAGDIAFQRMLLMICMLGCLGWYILY